MFLKIEFRVVFYGFWGDGMKYLKFKYRIDGMFFRILYDFDDLNNKIF